MPLPFQPAVADSLTPSSTTQVAPQQAPSTPSCKSSGSSSTLPEPSLPLSYLSSQAALAVRQLEAAPRNVLSRWWYRRRRRGHSLSECVLELSSLASSATAAGGGGEGWRFVRLRSDTTVDVGWGVYELWVEAVGDGR